MIRRRRAVLLGSVCSLSALILPSCATFDRNDIAAQVGDISLTAREAETLAAAGGAPANGDQLRLQLTKWIRVTVLEESNGIAAPASPPTSADLDARFTAALSATGSDTAQASYESGVSGSPVLCLAAITAASLDDANSVLDAINSGMPFADAARQLSTDTILAEDGGIVRGPDGGECIDPAGVNAAVVEALQDAPVGQPIAADLDTFSAVLMLRPYDDLLPESKSLIASTSVSQDRLDEIVDAANVYVDPRYGRWDPESGAVVTLTS